MLICIHTLRVMPPISFDVPSPSCAPLVASREAGRAAMAVMPLFRARKAGAPPASPAKKATGFAAAAANAMTKAAANPYEAERNARIAANLAKMKQFKLFDAKQKLEVRH